MADPKLGTEFQVNTYTPDRQRKPDVAIDADGNFVVAWDSQDQDGDQSGIYIRRYAGDGTALDSDIQVNTTTLEDQENPAVAMDANGNFVVIWEGSGSDPTRGAGAEQGKGIFAQRYDSAGNAIGIEFQVNTTIEGNQETAKVAMDADGDFVAIWRNQEYDVYAQRFDRSGVAQGEEFLVADVRFSGNAEPEIAMATNGNFVVTWSDISSDNIETIWAQRYDSAGNLQGNPISVYSVLSEQNTATVDMDDAGNFVVSWYFNSGVFARRYDSLGNPQSNELLVSSSGSENVDVALGNDGDFVVTWDGGGGVFVGRFDRANTPQGSEFQISSINASAAEPPAIAMDATGNYVITWAGRTDRTDPDEDIYAQRFANTSNIGGGKSFTETAKAHHTQDSNGDDTSMGLDHRELLAGGRGYNSLGCSKAQDMLKGDIGTTILMKDRERDVLVEGGDRDHFLPEAGFGIDIIFWMNLVLMLIFR